MNVVDARGAGAVTVGPYRLIGTLGEGGMGVVHLALDPAGRAVAVKVLRPQVAADAVARRRLGREVATLRRVRHPHVAEVLDSDLFGPVPYLVTAFVPARTLEQQVGTHGPPPVAYTAQVGRQLIGALRAIHAAGVVHRDVKPANVLLQDDAPILIDFGIAHVVDESRITSVGLVMGTPGYLAPEVIDGQPITPATDWWGWGATLAFAATGRPPFGTGPASVVLDRVRRGQVDLAGVDERLARVLVMALNVNPLWRGTAEMLLAGLAGIEAWRPAARPLSPALSPDQVRTVPIVTPEAVGPVGSHPAPPAVVTLPVPAEPVATAAAGTRHSAPTSPLPGTLSPAALAPPPAPSLRPPATQPPAPPRQTTRPLPATTSSPAPTAAGAAGGLALAALATLAVLAAVAPGLVVVLSLGWAVVARVADRTVTQTLMRRHDLGQRAGERSRAVLALPWRTISALPRAAFAAILPLGLAICAAFVVGAAVAPDAPRPGAAPSLITATLAGWFAAWWGPGGATMRRGTRAIARSVGRQRRARRAVMIALALVAVASVLRIADGAAPDWQPVDTTGDRLAGGVATQVNRGVTWALGLLPGVPDPPDIPDVPDIPDPSQW